MFLTSALFLVFENSGQRTNVRLHLYGKLVAIAQKLLGVLAHTDTCRCSGEDDGAGGQSSALGAKADESGDVEDEIAAESCRISQCLFCIFQCHFSFLKREK